MRRLGRRGWVPVYDCGVIVFKPHLSPASAESLSNVPGVEKGINSLSRGSRGSVVLPHLDRENVVFKATGKAALIVEERWRVDESQSFTRLQAVVQRFDSSIEVPLRLIGLAIILTLERGEKFISLDSLAHLARALRVPLAATLQGL